MKEIARDDCDIGPQRDNSGDRFLEGEVYIDLALIHPVLGKLVVPPVPKMHISKVTHSEGQLLRFLG